MNPLSDGPSSQLTDCNVSYKRPALNVISDVWRVEFHEPAVHAALRAIGSSNSNCRHRLWSIRIERRAQPAEPGSVSNGALFGSMRAVYLSPLKRTACACFLRAAGLAARTHRIQCDAQETTPNRICTCESDHRVAVRAVVSGGSGWLLQLASPVQHRCRVNDSLRSNCSLVVVRRRHRLQGNRNLLPALQSRSA